MIIIDIDELQLHKSHNTGFGQANIVFWHASHKTAPLHKNHVGRGGVGHLGEAIRSLLIVIGGIS